MTVKHFELVVRVKEPFDLKEFLGSLENSLLGIRRFGGEVQEWAIYDLEKNERVDLETPLLPRATGEDLAQAARIPKTYR